MPNVKVESEKSGAIAGTIRAMFTGIVHGKARIGSVQRNAFGARLTIDRAGWRPMQHHGGYQPAEGDSICISGVCLTVTEATDAALGFDVIVETLSRTTLGELKPGAEVNIEPSLLPSTPMGGHFMQGHVDGVGTVQRVTGSAGEWRMAIEPPAELMDCVIPKGSIGIDGVSLTIAAVGRSDFEVALIPTTLELTTLGRAKAGDRVNLETDIVSKTVVHWLRRQGEGGRPVTMETLRRSGFVD